MEVGQFFKFSQLLLRDEFVLRYSGYVSEDILEAEATRCARDSKTMPVMADRSALSAGPIAAQFCRPPADCYQKWRAQI